MTEFWKQFEKSVIVSSVIALALVMTACYLWATGQTLPTGLTSCLGLVLGFFFGVKVENSVSKRRQA